MVIFLEIERKTNNKFSNLNRTCMKEHNMNLVNIYDTSLKHKKNNNGFKNAIKLKRNFK